MVFLNRNNKKSSSNTSECSNSGATNASTIKNPLLHLPPETSRRYLRDKILTAAATVYIRHGVNTSLDLDEDTDLSKEAKVKKREEQYAAHQAYKERLQAVLGNQSLFPVISTCLLLDPKVERSSQSLTTAVSTISMHDSFACIALLLCNYVLYTASHASEDSSTPSESGCDARVRNVLRMASIQVLTEALEKDDTTGNLWRKLQDRAQPRPMIALESCSSIEDEGTNQSGGGTSEEKTDDTTTTEKELSGETSNQVYSNLYRIYATRKFNALEKCLAEMMMTQVVEKTRSKQNSDSKESDGEGSEKKIGRFSRKSLVRAAKIGGVGVVAGTLFAVTGGLAAPGIAAGLAALGVGSTALTVAASPIALITLFGAGGGGLSAYKMKRRTDGLSEFTINQEAVNDMSTTSDTERKAATVLAHLSTTICISGWLTDEFDFQRPWGVIPNNLSRLERLKRFFSVVDPERAKEAKEMYKDGDDRGSEIDEELWSDFSVALKQQYGKTPDTLLPLTDRAVSLSRQETITLVEIFDAILQPVRSSGSQLQMPPNTSDLDTMSTRVPALAGETAGNFFHRQSSIEKATALSRVWDHQTEYGGDIYTIRWESAILLKMCQIANNMAREIANTATKEILKKTALATIMAAVAWPSFLLSLAGSLDSDWTLITIRSDLAGVELAKSLLQSGERRPVNLIGFSFGARIIYACLIELNRHQILWEQQQQKDKKSGDVKKKGMKTDKDCINYTREPASIVQDVIMMGAPLFVSRSKLRLARHMVAGRFVNCYSRKDWILSLMFQYKNTSGVFRGTCGTGAVDGVSGIENYDVSHLVSSWHANYCHSVPDILDMVGFNQPLPTNFTR